MQKLSILSLLNGENNEAKVWCEQLLQIKEKLFGKKH